MGQALAAFECGRTGVPSVHQQVRRVPEGPGHADAQELRGLALFNGPTKGNCAACHPSTSADGATPPMFTDYSYDNLGVPRNALIPANTAAAPAGYTPANSDDGVQATTTWASAARSASRR